MSEIFTTALMCSLITQFIYACFWEGMIFGKVAGWLMDGKVKKGVWKERLPEWLQKPLFGCPICMTPYYTIIILAVLKYTGYLGYSTVAYLLIIFAASGISTIFSRIYD